VRLHVHVMRTRSSKKRTTGDVAINVQWYKRLGESAVHETEENIKYAIWEGGAVC
jgi:hypothetical protein